MTDTTLSMWTLAQAAGGSVSGTEAITGASGAAPAASTVAPGGTAPPPPGGAAASPFGGPFIFMMFGLLGLMIFMQVMAGRKEKKKRAALMESLKRGDKVMTIAGIIGTVDSLRDDEIVLKVDPNSNAKLTFARSAVQTVLSQSGGGSSGESAPSVEVKAKAEKAAAR